MNHIRWSPLGERDHSKRDIAIKDTRTEAITKTSGTVVDELDGDITKLTTQIAEFRELINGVDDETVRKRYRKMLRLLLNQRLDLQKIAVKWGKKADKPVRSLDAHWHRNQHRTKSLRAKAPEDPHVGDKSAIDQIATVD